MKILLVHNRYQQPGGEDGVFAQEKQMLESKGHCVLTYERTNSEVIGASPFQKLNIPKNMIWAEDAYRQSLALLREERPDIVHVHNTFFRISPSIFAACREVGVPTVKTLHNFRLLCPAATFFRNGKVCEECQDSSLWRGVRHACYRQSFGATAAIAAMLTMHKKLGTWQDGVTSYIALTDFARRKFAEGGLPPKKITVKPNFVFPDPGEKNETGEGAVFVGRLSPEKGAKTLLRAWRQLRTPIPLRIFGDGPSRQELERTAFELNLPHVSFMGHTSRSDVQRAIQGARLLILPSECYENFPLTIVEAFSCGTPVVCSRLGAMQELVMDGVTGLHFAAGNAEDLAERLAWAWDHTTQVREMGRAARWEFEQKYTADVNYAHLMSIYERALSVTTD